MKNLNVNLHDAAHAAASIKCAENILREMFINTSDYDSSEKLWTLEEQLRKIRLEFSCACNLCTRNFNEPCTNCNRCSMDE